MGGALALARGFEKNRSLKKLCVASCGIGSSGVEFIANALNNNDCLLELDLGFLKATAATGELPNRAEDKGAHALTAALKTNNTLRALKTSHNAIGLEGRRAFRDALCGERPNMALLVLEYEQRGMPRDPQLLRDEVAASLLRNLAGLSDVERVNVQAELRQHHLSEIASVYRLGNVYSPGLPTHDTSL